LLISEDLDELLGLSDRVLVIFKGAIVAEFARNDLNRAEIGLRMGGEA
jgi:simple sugar transport system ATP-binding protein